MRLSTAVSVYFAVVATMIPAASDAQSAPRTEPASGSSVKIQSIRPPLGTLLHIGDKVKFEVEIAYSVKADSATIGLIVQRGESGSNAVLAFTTDLVSRGDGILKMATEATIPETRVIHIFTPLSHQGDAYTTVVDSRAYKVVPQ